MPESATILLQGRRLLCRGEWSVHRLSDVILAFETIVWPEDGSIVFDGSAITRLDSAASWLLLSWQATLKKRDITVRYEQFPSEAVHMMELVTQSGVIGTSMLEPPEPAWWYCIFRSVGEGMQGLLLYFAFIGRLTGEILNVFVHPQQWRMALLARQINLTGFRALPIIALLSGMVGVVLAYQLGIQLKNYGANIFIADLLGMSVLREFGPLLTAIMVAGRTGSAFTAEIGMMKINQEIDALQTMGISPESMLIIPRMLGLLIVLPLLTLWADIFGILGGMVMAGNMLDVTWYDFLLRMQHQVPIRMLVIGLCKAPVFAFLIAGIGCFEGMQVKSNADSLGKNTTRSVVLAIFMIILVDAAFSMLFSKLRL